MTKKIEIFTRDANYPADSQKKLGDWQIQDRDDERKFHEVWRQADVFMDAESKVLGLPEREVVGIVLIYDKSE